MRSRTATGLVLALVLVATAARAEGDSCVAAAEEGQRARQQGKLRAAHELFLACSSESCKAIVRRDCTQWTSETESLIPSIVVDAKEDGHDIADVTVTMDGEVLVKSLDGKSIPVDPGAHRLTFTRAGRESVTQEIIVKEGVRARVLEVRFGRAEPAAKTPQATEVGHSVLPWVVVTAGGVLLTAGVLLILTAPALPPNCDTSSATCYKSPAFSDAQHVAETDAQLQADRDRAGTRSGRQNLGVIALVSGGALVAGGLLWHFLEPTGAPSGARRITPWVANGSAGANASWTF